MVWLRILQKRFYTRGTLRSINILLLAKSQSFIVIGWDPWIKKMSNFMNYIEGKGGLKLERHSLLCTKCRATCWSIRKYLLIPHSSRSQIYHLNMVFNNSNFALSQTIEQKYFPVLLLISIKHWICCRRRRGFIFYWSSKTVE